MNKIIYAALLSVTVVGCSSAPKKAKPAHVTANASKESSVQNGKKTVTEKVTVERTTVIDAPPGAAATSACPAGVDKMKSPVGERAKADIAFANESKTPVDVYWMSFKGEPKKYRTLKAGENYKQSSFVGHIWVIRNPEGQCLTLFTVTPGETLAIIK